LRKRIPLKGESVSEIRAYNIVEHLEVKDIMKEFYRVLKKGGILDILCPFAGHSISFQFDHKYQLKVRDFYYYEPDNPTHHYVSPVSFKLISAKYFHGYPRKLFPLWLLGEVVQHHLNTKSRKFREKYECYLSNFFPMKEFRIVLEKA
jgi:predicted SAM-dependent methyltransferase